MAVSLDRVQLEAACPRCGFYFPFTFRQARLQDVIICRGCKANVCLDDHMGECRKAARRVEDSIARLARSLGR